ncbi:MAG: hypothetical protein KGP29_08020, partial [Proteobacteria bacterium]|nr:hypothetical protein [Pseudomonadota bacterium]
MTKSSRHSPHLILNNKGRRSLKNFEEGEKFFRAKTDSKELIEEALVANWEDKEAKLNEKKWPALRAKLKKLSKCWEFKSLSSARTYLVTEDESGAFDLTIFEEEVKKRISIDFDLRDKNLNFGFDNIEEFEDFFASIPKNYEDLARQAAIAQFELGAVLNSLFLDSASEERIF